MALTCMLYGHIPLVLASLLLAALDSGDGGTVRPHPMSKSQELHNRLFKHYHSAVQPVVKSNEQVKVKISFALYRIIQLDERLQLLDTSVWIRSEWSDTRLTWTPSLYDNITTLMTAYPIWTPDIILFDSMRVDHKNVANVVKHVSYTGRVSWLGSALYKTFCKLDTYYFPFDRQQCPFEFGTSSYGSMAQGVVSGSERGDIGEFVSNGDWEVVEIPAKTAVVSLPCCQQSVSRVTYTIVMQRKGANYIAKTLLPVFLLMIMIAFSFYLPAQSREKIFFNVIILLSLTVFSIATAGLNPAQVDQTSILEQCLVFAQVLVVISTVLNVVVICVHDHGKYGWNVPIWLSNIIFNKLSKFVFYSRKVALYRINTEQAASKRRIFLEGINAMETAVHLESEVDGVLSSLENPFELHAKVVSAPPTKTMQYLKLHKNIKLQLKHLTNDMADKIRMERVLLEWGLVSEILGRFFFFVVSFVVGIIFLAMLAQYLIPH